jgi:hypothetical protein
MSPAFGPAWTSVTLTLTATGLKSPSGATTNVDLTGGAGAYAGVYFSSATCAATEGTAGAGMTPSLVYVSSATSMTLNSPAFNNSAKTDYNLCVYTAAAPKPLLTTAKFTAYPRPTVSNNGISPNTGSVRGGQTVTVEGTNFTSKTTATLGGLPMTNIKVAKDALSFTATTPTGTAGTPVILVSNEGGASASASGATYYTYVATLTISPNTGLAAGGNIVTITGSGFNAYQFSNGAAATGDEVVAFVAGGFNIAAGQVIVNLCSNYVVADDSTLTCAVPAALDGAYTAMVITRGATAAQVGSVLTTKSISATYTAAAI